MSIWKSIARQIHVLVEAGQVIRARRLLNQLPEAAFSDPLLGRYRRVLAVPTTTVRDGLQLETAAIAQWLRDHASAYRGRWVALVGSELTAEASTLKELLQLLQPMRLGTQPVLHRAS